MKYLFLALAFVLSTSPVFAQPKGQPQQKKAQQVQQKSIPIQINMPSNFVPPKKSTPIQVKIQQPHYVQPHFNNVQVQRNVQLNNIHVHTNVRPIHNYYHGAAYYRGRNYNAWTNYCYFPSYRCYGFYCGVDLTWYYWYAPRNCFLPTYYMPTMPPVVAMDSPVPAGVLPVQQQQILTFPAPVADSQNTEIIVTVYPDRIRDTGDLNKVLLNRTSQFKMMSITKLASNTYRVVLHSSLPERELCGEVSRLPGVVYAER